MPVIESKKKRKSASGFATLGLLQSDLHVFGLPSPFYMSQPRKQLQNRKLSIPKKSTVKRDGTIVSSAATSNQLESNFTDEQKKEESVPAKTQIKPFDTSPATNCKGNSDIKIKRLRKNLSIFD